ncbi:hypothetical protein GCM10023186_04600 [Hymenobacter koreensis]|uniref:Outer membrane protein beta-barrel domain-containing protein n=2 Tax=Hymenobacter koreensis TaxID=1084523 RepID=A0ABP8IUC5_9BACT
MLAGLLALASGSAAAQGVATPLPPATTSDTPARPTPLPHLSNFRTSSLAISLGWGAPYGFGIEYAHMLGSNFDVNAGAGIGVGGKIGIGTRYYFRPERNFTPYVGANLTRSGRVDNVDVTYNNETANYSMTPSGLLSLRGGFRWQPGHVGLSGTLGYGARLTGDPVVYSPYTPQPSQPLRDLVQTISPGGIEISIAMHIGLGR